MTSHWVCSISSWRSKNHGDDHKRTVFIFGLTSDTIEQDIEICVPLQNLRQALEVFSAEAELGAPFWPGKSSRSMLTLRTSGFD